MFIAALFTIAKIRKQTKCPSTDERMKKMWYIYTVRYYLAIKKEQNFAICSKLLNITKEKQTHRYRELVVTSGERE